MNHIRVRGRDAKRMRDILAEHSLLDNDYMAISDDTHVMFPVIQYDEAKRLAESSCIANEIVDVEGKRKNEKSIEELLREEMGEGYECMKRGFDIIGSIAIMEITEGYEDKAIILARSIMRLHKNVKSVYAKEGIHEGEYRIQGLKHLLGEDNKETMHIENGYRIFLEVGSTYFSPRLSQERLRIARLVRNDEDVLVLFSGVAPYGICIARHSNAKKIVCVEINPKAHEYAMINVKKNKAINVDCINDDATNAINDFIGRGMLFDRIIMPLPKTADDFLLSALKVCKENAVIHWYSFCGEEEIERSVSERLKLTIKDSAKCDIMNVQRAGQSSPGKMRVCADIRIKKNNAA